MNREKRLEKALRMLVDVQAEPKPYDQAMAASQNALKGKNAECRWIFDSNNVDPFSDHYTTGCEQGFEFIGDGPDENGMIYCPYCGRSLVEVKEVER